MAVRTIPILPSPDLDATVEFYAPLGFAMVGQWPDEYLIIEHPVGIELHFWHHPAEDPQTNDVACYMRFDTRAESVRLYETFRDLDLPEGGSGAIPRLHRWEDDPDQDEWDLIDVHGNLLRFGLPAD